MKINKNTWGMSTLRIHTLDLLHLLIDKHVKQIFIEISTKTCSIMEENQNHRNLQCKTLFY